MVKKLVILLGLATFAACAFDFSSIAWLGSQGPKVAPAEGIGFDLLSTWKYRDTGVDLGTSWRTNDYDDSAWASGPGRLGYDTGGNGEFGTVISYGGNTSDKYRTYYFRRTFNLPSASNYNRMFMEVHRNDGLVVYMNGMEVFRSNISNNVAVAYSHFATNATDQGTNLQGGWIHTNYLREGTNQLAVEVHQSSATSSDIRFDMRLTPKLTGTLTTVTTNFSTAGSATWLWPDDVAMATVEAWGGGGGSGGVGGNGSASGGGKGGGYSSNVVFRAGYSTNVMSIIVGNGGTAGAAASGAGGNGGPSYVWQMYQGTNTTNVLATGGSGSAGVSTGGAAGAGATTAIGTAIGAVTYDGGNGATAPASNQSGGGGGAAGSGGAGGNASGMTAGTGTATNPNDGTGGAGRSGGGTGTAGTTYGGGAGGAYANNATDQQGAAGGSGYVRIRYTTSTYGYTTNTFSELPTAYGSIAQANTEKGGALKIGSTDITVTEIAFLVPDAASFSIGNNIVMKIYATGNCTTPVASVTQSTAGAVRNTWLWGVLSSPVTLTAGTTYNVLFANAVNGDYLDYHGWNTVQANHTADAGIVGALWQCDGYDSTTTNWAYAGFNLKYYKQ